MSDKSLLKSTSELSLKASSKSPIGAPCTPLPYSPDKHRPPNLLSPPHTHLYIPDDSWDDLTPAQIAAMTPEETRQMLLRAAAYIATLTRTLRSERAGAAHHTLQHKLLTLEIREVSQRYSVEINLIRREVDRLLYELALPSNTYKTLNFLNLKNDELVHFKKSPTKKPNSSSNNATYKQENNGLATLGLLASQELGRQNLEQHSSSANELSSGLLSPITFHPSSFKRSSHNNTIEEDNAQYSHQILSKKQKVSKLNNQNTKRKYALRSCRSMPISPITSPLHQ